MEVEAREHGLGAVAVGELDGVEADVALAVEEVDRPGAIGDRGLLVEDLVEPLGRGRGPLAHHDEHPEHHERRLQHQQVGVEGQDRPDAEVSVDHHVATEEKDESETGLRQVLERRGPLRPQVGVFDVSPLELVGRLGKRAELVGLGGEGLHDADAVDVLVDDRRDVREPRLDQPGDGEHRLPHPHPGEVDEGHRRHGDEGEDAR